MVFMVCSSLHRSRAEIKPQLAGEYRLTPRYRTESPLRACFRGLVRRGRLGRIEILVAGFPGCIPDHPGADRTPERADGGADRRRRAEARWHSLAAGEAARPVLDH